MCQLKCTRTHSKIDCLFHLTPRAVFASATTITRCHECHVSADNPKQIRDNQLEKAISRKQKFYTYGKKTRFANTTDKPKNVVDCFLLRCSDFPKVVLECEKTVYEFSGERCPWSHEGEPEPQEDGGKFSGTYIVQKTTKRAFEVSINTKAIMEAGKSFFLV